MEFPLEALSPSLATALSLEPKEDNVDDRVERLDVDHAEVLRWIRNLEVLECEELETAQGLGVRVQALGVGGLFHMFYERHVNQTSGVDGTSNASWLRMKTGPPRGSG